MMRGGDDQNPRLFYELCALLFTILRSPHVAFPPAGGPTASPPSSPRAAPAVAPAARSPRSAAWAARRGQLSPAGVASLLLGASLALMLCGSVTFFIGFILMPWVIGLVMFFYFVGIVSSVSGLGRAILFPGSASSPKEMSGQLFCKLPII